MRHESESSIALELGDLEAGKPLSRENSGIKRKAD